MHGVAGSHDADFDGGFDCPERGRNASTAGEEIVAIRFIHSCGGRRGDRRPTMEPDQLGALGPEEAASAVSVPPRERCPRAAQFRDSGNPSFTMTAL